MKIISRLLFAIFFLIFLSLIYLSFFGIETQKFNKQIVDKIKSLNKNLDIRLNTIKVVLDPFKFKINAKTIGPKIINKNNIIEIESIKTKISLKALFDDKFSVENLEISTKSLEVNNLISFIRSIYQKPEFYILEKTVRKGFLIADIKLEFDDQGKIKKNYNVKGFLKDVNLSLINRFNIDKLNLIFDLKKDELNITDTNLNLNSLSFKSNKISVRNLGNAFFVKGKIEHKKFSLEDESLSKLLNEFNKNLNFKTLSFSSKNDFSFKLDKSLKIKDLEIFSKVNLEKLSILNEFELKSFFPKIKKNISINNNELEIKYKKKNLSVFGSGKILLQNQDDNISYEFIKHKEDLKFKTSIKISDNPLDINFLNYNNHSKNDILVDIKGVRKKNNDLLINLFSLKEKNNIFSIRNLKLDKKYQITGINQLNFDYLDKDNKKNSISMVKKNKEYFVDGSYFNAESLIENIFNGIDKSSKILNINSLFKIDIDKVGLDKNNDLSNLKGKLVLKNHKVINGKLEGLFTKNKKLRLTINTNGNNRITTLYSDQAEPIVRRYNFIKGFDSGELDFYNSFDGEETKSTLKIYNFKLKELPALTKILTLASLQGIADTLSGEGIRFNEFEMNFRNKNNLMTIDEIYAIGPAISILMNGYVEKDKLISLRGTLVPATTINKFISSLPVLGDILVGSKTGEGVFGVSFKIKGPPKNLTTTVNPIKTLTPRFITRTLEKIKKN